MFPNRLSTIMRAAAAALFTVVSIVPLAAQALPAGAFFGGEHRPDHGVIIIPV